MSDLSRLREWLNTYPNAADLDGIQVDYTDQLPGQFGVFPAGLIEVNRRSYITGEALVENQYNFALYIVFEKAPGDGVGAQINADWLMHFQRWVQTQSVTHQAPTFGNTNQDRETIVAQNGALYESDGEGLAMYMVQLTASFNLLFEEENEWLT